MKRVATAVVLIPLVLLLILRAPVFLLAGTTAVVALLGVRELLALAEHYGVKPQRIPAYVCVIVIFSLVAILSAQTQMEGTGESLLTLLALPTVAIFVFLALGMSRTEISTAYPAAATSLAALLYVAMPLALLVMVRKLIWDGGFLLLYLLLVVWSGDTSAYYTGRAIGRHKLAPRVSPGKTWEGALASFGGSILVGWTVFAHAPQISSALHSAGLIGYKYMLGQTPPVLPILVLSACINVAGQLGDLVESLIKRGAGVKDSGALLPGHGGILDRVDALLFAAPVLWYYAALRVMGHGHL